MHRRQFVKCSLLAAGASLVPFEMARGDVKPKRVLILGGTFFLGPALVDALIADGHKVTLFNRGVTNPDLFPHLEKLRGFRSADPNDQDLTALENRRFDAIVDVWPSEPDEVASAATLLKEHTGHYLYVSSIGAYDNRQYSQPLITEDTPLQPWDLPARRTIGTRRRASGDCTRSSAIG